MKPIERLRRVIDLEQKAEQDEARRLRREFDERELERRGICARRLRLHDEKAGPGGRVLASLGNGAGTRLPPHRLQAGDLVEIRDSSGRSTDVAAGVLYRVHPDRLVVALDDDVELPSDDRLRLDRVANDTTWGRLRKAVSALGASDGPAQHLRDLAFGNVEPRPFTPAEGLSFQSDLDATQAEAVAFALAAPEMALIHGPPGTGKTTALVELIRLAVAKGESVLVSAPSNVAVDNLVERLAGRGLSMVRLGHPARLLPSVLSYGLDAQVERSEAMGFAAEARRDLVKVQRSIEHGRDREQKRAAIEERRELRREIRRHERNSIDEVLATSDVVLATHVGCGDHLLADRQFDLVVLDEAGQALEPASWIPMLKGTRVVMAGDHLQLPPTVRSKEAEREGLGRSLFDRLARRWDHLAVRRLSVQYRMHQAIMEFPSKHLYDGTLTAHESVAAHTLADLDGVEATDATERVFQFVDTAGCDLEESSDAESPSRANEGEVGLVAGHVRALLDSGVAERDIAVIAPYNLQVQRLREALSEFRELEIGSVDGFQGREKEAIVVSFVRSNPQGDLGFVADSRRTNVAMTRARRHLTLIGDSATLTRDTFLSALVTYAEESGGWRTAWELL